MGRRREGGRCQELCSSSSRNEVRLPAPLKRARSAYQNRVNYVRSSMIPCYGSDGEAMRINRPPSP